MTRANKEKLSFSQWISKKEHDLDKAGDAYESLSEISKKVLDAAIYKYVEYLIKKLTK